LYDLRKTGYIGREEVLWIHPLPCDLRGLWTMLYWFSLCLIGTSYSCHHCPGFSVVKATQTVHFSCLQSTCLLGWIG
jgi:hypothetical protein